MKDHGEICHACALRLGGKPPSWDVTCWEGECPYCHEKKSLCSTRDYSWPDGRKAVWD